MSRLGSIALRNGKQARRAMRRAYFRQWRRDDALRLHRRYPNGTTLEAWRLGRKGKPPILCFSVIAASDRRQYRFRNSHAAKLACAAMETGCFNARDYFGELI